MTLTRLLAGAVDGDRLLFLQQVGPTSMPPYPATFTALFDDAFAAQQDARSVPARPRLHGQRSSRY